MSKPFCATGTVDDIMPERLPSGNHKRFCQDAVKRIGDNEKVIARTAMTRTSTRAISKSRNA
jgi:hypothetical protein